MACRTCGGTKVVNDLDAREPRYDFTCTACSGQLAGIRVEENEQTRVVWEGSPLPCLIVAGECVDFAYAGPDVRAAGHGPGGDEELVRLQFLANAINAAVENREAKLRARIRAAFDVVNVAIRRVRERTTGEGDWMQALIDLSDLLATEDSAVSGDVACGLAWDLGAARGIIEGSWGVLLDRMLEQGGESAIASLELGNRLGLRLHGSFSKASMLGLFDTAELRAELERRRSTAIVDGTCHSEDCDQAAVYGQRYCRRHLRALYGDGPVDLDPVVPGMLRALNAPPRQWFRLTPPTDTPVEEVRITAAARGSDSPRPRCRSSHGVMPCELGDGHRGRHRFGHAVW